MPSADGLSNVVKGFASAVHPLELAAANLSILFTGAALVGFGYTVGVAACAEPTPFEPVTCAGGLLAGECVGAIGVGDLTLGAAFFKNITLPAFENWGGGE